MSVSDFVFVHARSPAGAARRNRVVRMLEGHGWRTAGQTPGGRLLVGPGSPPPVRPLGADGLIVGRHTAPPPSSPADPLETADALIRAGWGRYVALWSSLDGIQTLRDPSGAMDAVAWRSGDLTMVASAVQAAFDPLQPDDLAIDWDEVRRLTRTISAAGFATTLQGVTPVPPGSFLSWGEGSQPSLRSLWRPAAFAKLRESGGEAALRAVVETAVAGLIRPHDRLVGEISGGFDSAVVAATAERVAEGKVGLWVNYHGEETESDERFYAEALARRAGLALVSRRKRPAALAIEDLRLLATGFRPALHGLDVEYDRDMAEEMERQGATGLVTGQGGDAVFFQFVSQALAADRARRLGPAGLDPRFLYRLSRASRRPIWSTAKVGLRSAVGLPPRRPFRPEVQPEFGLSSHPWLEGVGDLPPAKADQVRALANSLVFWGDCRRARAGELLHPLLTQPVLEHCLAVPADRLAPDGWDRGLARRAFSDRLPPEILERRGKGELSTYYGQVVLRSLPLFRDLLIDGELMKAGAIDRASTEALLDADTLIWSGDYNLALIQAVLELWVRHWRDRLARVRAGEMLV